MQIKNGKEHIFSIDTSASAMKLFIHIIGHICVLAAFFIAAIITKKGKHYYRSRFSKRCRRQVRNPPRIVKTAPRESPS